MTYPYYILCVFGKTYNTFGVLSAPTTNTTKPALLADFAFVAVNMFEIPTLRLDSIKNQPYAKNKSPEESGRIFLGSVVVR